MRKAGEGELPSAGMGSAGFVVTEDSIAGEATEPCPCSHRHDDKCEKHPGPALGERRRILGLLEAARDVATAGQAFYLGKIIEAVRNGDREVLSLLEGDL